MLSPGGSRAVMPSGDWIPKDTLVAANVFHGISWLALLGLALRGVQPGSLPSLAWVHLFALGWLTVAALSILVHVVPAFLGVKWVAQNVVRWAIRGFILGIATLATGFGLTDLVLVQLGALIVFFALCVYLVPAGTTIVRGLASGPRERLIGRAFLFTLAFFFVVAALGVVFALALGGRITPRVLTQLPQAHAVLAIAGWLTLLVFGVSSRTMRAIAGKTPWLPLHIASTSLVLFGALIYINAMAASVSWLIYGSAAAICLGGAIYAVDLLDILRRREHPNTIPQLFVLAADLSLIACVFLGAGTIFGQPWGTALTYLALVGWVGQMVNGHIFHIGIRLLITAVRGDDDETRPWVVISRPPAYASWIFFQVAGAIGTAALLSGGTGPQMVLAALSGLLGWISMVVAIVMTYFKLQGGSRDISLLRA